MTLLGSIAVQPGNTGIVTPGSSSVGPAEGAIHHHTHDTRHKSENESTVVTISDDDVSMETTTVTNDNNDRSELTTTSGPSAEDVATVLERLHLEGITEEDMRRPVSKSECTKVGYGQGNALSRFQNSNIS